MSPAGLIHKRKKNNMKNLIFALAAIATLAPPAHAEDAKPDNETSFNAALTSDYRYRGISQTRLAPAVQGGFDYTHNPSGWYAGTWLSTIKWTRDAGGGGDIEWDLYAGKRGELGAGVSYDVGALGYAYPANGLKHVSGFADADTGEVYGQLGYGPAYVKYSMALTNLFGFVDSRRSGYVDLGATLAVAEGLKINLHAGHQQVRHNSQASYTDWKLGVSKDFALATCSLALVGTNASRLAYASPADGRFLGKKALVATIGRNF
jgi:uncharacterized protein (TIGR02001 family)